MTMHRTSLTVGELTIVGTCTGGVATSLAVPELGVCWDIGACLHASVRSSTLLVTHGHADHMGALHAWLGNRMLYRMPPATLYVPKWIAADVQSLVDTWGRLQGGPFPVDIVAAEPGGEYPLRRDLTIRPFKSAHVVPTLGYTVVRHKTKLRPEWLDVPGPEIAAMRREGRDDLFTHVEEPLIAYTGDTLIDLVEREELVRRCKTLLIECTFLDDRKPRSHVKAGGHIHLDEIADRADLFENEHLVLVHFSQLYTVAEVKDLVARRLPPALLSRVHLFVGR
jgi:ribonuclease Z